MSRTEVEILLVEDDPADMELTMHALQAELSATGSKLRETHAADIPFILVTGSLGAASSSQSGT